MVQTYRFLSFYPHVSANAICVPIVYTDGTGYQTYV